MRMNDEELPILSAEVKHRAKTWSLNQTRILKTRFSIGSEYSDESPYPSTPHDQLVWYPHPKHAWLLGKIVSENASRYTVVPIPSGMSTSPRCFHHRMHNTETLTGTPDQSNTVRSFTRDQTRPFDASHVNTLKDDDLASFNELTVAPLLDTLRRRFFRLLPYTYISDIVIAVNPYKAYPHMTTLPEPLVPYE